MMDDVADIREQFIELKSRYPEGNVGGLLELRGASFVANEEAIFGEVNRDYVRREIVGYLSESLSVLTMERPIPKIWLDISMAEGMVNSNYGYLFKSRHNGFQFDNVVTELSRDPESRRALAIYTRPTMHDDWSGDGHGMNDFVCTNAVQYMVRDNGTDLQLDVIVQMRSNDVVFGYRNDYAWQRYAAWMVADALRDGSDQFAGLTIGQIIWQVGSLHVYPRHFNLVK